MYSIFLLSSRLENILDMVLNKLIFYLHNLGRTKVECAGLCLSIENCHAFNWISAANFNLAGDDICRLLKIDGICLTTDYDPIEIYVDAKIDIPSCAGKNY